MEAQPKLCAACLPANARSFELKENKKELSDLTYAIKELTDKIDNLEKKV